MLVAISLFSGLFEIISNWIAFIFQTWGSKEITDALPVQRYVHLVLRVLEGFDRFYEYFWCRLANC
jgi:hypothetical protein